VRNLRVKKRFEIFSNRCGYRSRELSQIIFTKVVVALIGLASGVLTPEMYTVIVIVALVIRWSPRRCAMVKGVSGVWKALALPF
jgi:hypothetical protein